MIEPFACSPSDVADMFLVLIRWNNRGGLETYFCHVERSRLPSRSFMRMLKTSQYSIQRFDPLTSRSLNLRSSRLCRGFPSRSILDFARDDSFSDQNASSLKCRLPFNALAY